MSLNDVLVGAVRKCPFLNEMAKSHGEDFARSVALNPTVTVGTPAAGRRPILEEFDSFESTFRLFHGSSGVVPLPSSKFNTSRGSAPSSGATASRVPTTATTSNLAAPSVASKLAQLPLATMSFGGFGAPDFGKFGDLFKKKFQAKKPSSNGPSSNSNARGPPNPQPPGATAGGTLANPTGAAASSGMCPMRKFLGPAAHVVFTGATNIKCPEVIIQARAALARTQAVQELRPQGLGIKLLAVGSLSAAVNVPCGAWREHFEKFSPGWVLTVHMSIPFIAMLRKAIIMPQWVIIFTIASAIAGQAVGARLERQRLTAAGIFKPAKLTKKTREAGSVAGLLSPESEAMAVAVGSPAATNVVSSHSLVFSSQKRHSDLKGTGGHAAGRNLVSTCAPVHWEHFNANQLVVAC